MKKLLASIFALAMIVTSGVAFVGCKDKNIAGTYRFSAVNAMGLSGSRKDIAEYKDSIEAIEDTNEFAYIFDIVLAMELKIKKNETGEIKIKDFMILTDNEVPLPEGLELQGSDLVFGIEYEKVGKNKIKIYPVLPDGSRIEGGIGAFLEGSGGSVVSEDFIGVYKNGKLTLSILFGQYDEDTMDLEEEFRAIVFEINFNLIFKKK